MAKENTKAVFVDFSIGDVPLIKIVQTSPDPETFVYTIHVQKPDGAPFMPPVTISNPASAKSIEWLVARAMAARAELAYGLDDRPYLWVGNHWVESESWMAALSTSMDALINTGTLISRAAKCFYTRMRTVWAMQNNPRLQLRPFGLCRGIPLQDKVLLITTEGVIVEIDHAPEHQNMHFLPLIAQDVINEFIELQDPKEIEPLLFKFLRTSLTPDQISTLQSWFGLHLVLHQVARPQKMLFMHGEGGNGKGVIIDLLKCLITEDAVASLRLRDLQKSSNIELLVGKLAMIGAEATAVTDNEILKSIVAMETVPIDPKYRDPYNFTPECLVTQASNAVPRFDDDSDAMVRRVIAINMSFQPKKESDLIQDIMEHVKAKEYPLLMAFALKGAIDVVTQGRIIIPKSVAEHSESVVRPVRAVDRFLDILEYGNFEVADEELYMAYSIYCRKQQLQITPKSNFYSDLVKRFVRKGTPFERRPDVTGYMTSSMINEKGVSVMVVPQLKELKKIDLFFGFRIKEGEFGTSIGQPISTKPKRREIPDFEHLNAITE